MKQLCMVVLCLATLGCPRPPTPTPPIGPPKTVENCGPGLQLPTVDDVCDGMFTPEGLACVRCPNAQGCLNTFDVVYCVVGTCNSDTRCKYETGLRRGN